MSDNDLPPGSEPPVGPDDKAGGTSGLTPLGRLGDFELIREIGRGGMGVVYEARQISLNRRVALKVLPPALGLTGTAVQRFQREAQAAAKLHHTNIVPVHAIGESEGSHFYAMDLIDGQPLSEVLGDLTGAGSNPLLVKTVTKTYGDEERVSDASQGDPTLASLSDAHPGNSRKWFDGVAKLIAEVADALEYAHSRGVVHRDIKPGNLMLSTEGRLCITDFGLARVAQEPGMTVSGSLMGTPAYMSPEQITAGRVKLDHRTDVYSLGAVFYEMLAHRRPFPGESREEVLSSILTKDPRPPRRFNPRVPLDLQTIALKAMEKDPDRRYATAGEMAHDLRQYLHGGLITARRASLPRRIWKSMRRHPVASTAVAAVVVVLLVTGFSLRALRQADAPRLVAEANLALERGDHQAGLEAADRALALTPDMPEARIVRARLLLELGRHDAVVAEARELVEHDPDDWTAHFILAFESKRRPSINAAEHLAVVERLAPESADVYFLRGQLAETATKAAELYSQALELNPAHTWALLERGNTYTALKEFDAAKSDAERMLAIRPRSPRGRRMLGLYYRTRVERDFDRSLVEYSRAIELDPEDPNSYNERASVYNAMQRHDEAIADFTRAIEIGPARAVFHRNRGRTYQHLGRDEEAISDARRALELNPEDRGAFFILLDVYQKLVRMDEFERTADELRTLAAGWFDTEAVADAHGNLSWRYLRMGALDRALTEADRAVQADPDDLSARIQRIRVLRALNDRAGFEEECDALATLELEDPDPLENRAEQLGWTCLRWEQAVEYLDDIIEDHPDWAEPYVDRGTVKYRLKRYGDALPDFTRAIELNPRFEEAYTNRSVVYGSLYRLEEAIADRNKALELNPRNVVNLTNRAGRHEFVGRLEEAIADLNAALEVNPYHRFAHRVRAQVNNALGRFDEAAADARRVIELDSTEVHGYRELIRAYRGFGDDKRLREAIEQLRTAADVWVDDENAAKGFRDVADSLRSLGERGPALEAADRAIELDPDNPRGFLVRARVRFDRGDREGFVADCDRAAGVESDILFDRVDDLVGLGLDCGRLKQARAGLVRITGEDQNLAKAWFWLGRFDDRLGKSEVARADFGELVRIDPLHPRGYVERARVLAERADCDGALEQLRKARDLVPERLETRADEAWIHTAILFHRCPDEYDGPAALELARGVVDANPRKWEYQSSLGMALYRQGLFEEALGAFEDAYEIDAELANEPFRLFPLGLTQWQLGRREEGYALIKRAQALKAEISPGDPVLALFEREAARTLGID